MKTYFSFGNMKVGKDTAIFNITPAFECESEKLGLCSLGSKCYAKKAERLYPTVLPYRKKQTELWDRVSAKEFVILLLETIKCECRAIKFVRFQESGDFRTQEDVNKMSDIAELLKGKLLCYTYTARKDLDFSNVSDNLIINGSGFMVHNNFYIIKDESEMIDKYFCPGSCLNCKLCKTKSGRNIAVKFH